MNIFVVMKRTFDTEEHIVIENGKVSDVRAEYIINPYDEYAVEEAIKLREEHGGEVTVVTIGEEKAEKELQTALAMGVDKAVLINNKDLEAKDPSLTANLLAAFLKEKEADIILAGNVTVDGGTGQVGPRLADELGIAVVTAITKLVIDGEKATMERDMEGDIEIVEAKLPLLVTCQQGLNEPRYPSLPGIMKAKKKPLKRLKADDLDVADMKVKTKTVEVFLPPVKDTGKILEGALDQQVKNLVSLLKTDAKVI